MLLQEWNWDDAKSVWQEEAREDGMALGEARSDLKWHATVADMQDSVDDLQNTIADMQDSVVDLQNTVADKDSEIENLKAQLAQVGQSA